MVLRSFAGLVMLLFFMAGGGVAATWRVEQDGSGDFGTIQPAVDAAASGDTILIGPGWYQDLHQVDHYGNPIEVIAYWLDARDLTFIGSGPDQVTIGPSLYSPSNDGPQGIAYDGTDRNVSFRVYGIRFVNFYLGINSASVVVQGCRFEGGRSGIGCGQGASCLVHNCTFEGIEHASVLSFSCGDVEVSDCDLGQYVYFGDTTNGVIRACTATGRQLSYYYASNGLVEGNVADCYSGAGSVQCMVVTGGSDVVISGNAVSGGAYALTVDGQGSFAELRQNVFDAQSSHTILLRQGGTLSAMGNDFGKSPRSDVYTVWCYDYPWGTSPVRIDMENNFWGFTHPFYLDRYIWDHNDDPSLMVEIDYDPFAEGSVPGEQESWGSIKAQFLGK